MSIIFGYCNDIDLGLCFSLIASASLPAVPTQGTVLVDLGPEDPEYISVDEQVKLHPCHKRSQ